MNNLNRSALLNCQTMNPLRMRFHRLTIFFTLLGSGQERFFYGQRYLIIWLQLPHQFLF